MDRTVAVARLTVPLGGQQIELQQVDFATGGMKFLRVRIREGRRFTVFDVDPDTAAEWAAAMRAWAESARGAARREDSP
jgi:hypothetical protein